MLACRESTGWIYFERLVSTIRVALTDEQYAALWTCNRMET